jgi:hypothetical protein
MSETESRGRIERLDAAALESRLRETARRLLPDRMIDDLEVRHLVRVINECSLLLADAYSEVRLSRIMRPERGAIARLIDQLARQSASDAGELLQRMRQLPDDVRAVGDQALFDLGLRGLRSVRGYDLADLGARAYRVAGQALELLAEDRQLHEFFKQNRLLMLPLEEEVVFLRQCSDQFRTYAEILHHLGEQRRELDEVARRVPLMAAAAAALVGDEAGEGEDGVPVEEPDPAAATVEAGEVRLSREQLLSSYERMLLFSALDPERLRAALDARVVDQPRAVTALCDEFSLFAAGTRDPRRPPAYFLVGPTGVGKNHLVETLCRLLEGLWRIEVPMLSIEGPNYTYPSDINELRGATRGFIRSDEEGLLTAFHAKSSRAPLGVILVDEVEKAHPQLLTFFLSILDRGTTTDNRGGVLNFANCMLFFTSNLGYSDAQQRAAPIGYFEETERRERSDEDVRREVRRGLRPEFVNRLQVVHFDRLSRASAERILDLDLERIARRWREVHGLDVVLHDSAREELIRRGFSETYGARRLAATLESVCNVELARKVRRDQREVPADLDTLIAWLREMRDGRRPFAEDEVRRRVIDRARARLGYTSVLVLYDGSAFVYQGRERD